MKVIEIFGSIDGEGKRTGQLATFIRLAGCNLRCSYCDTKYSFDAKNAKDMSVDEIVTECKRIGYHNITLTGGEPLLDKMITPYLIFALCNNGFQVNVETNGSIDLWDLTTERVHQGLDLFFTVDFKTKFSGMRNKMNPRSFDCLTENDLVKCVVANREDMDDALQYLDSFKDRKFKIWFSPVFGAIEPKEIVEYIKEKNRQDITVQVQLHKIIWDPNERGV